MKLSLVVCALAASSVAAFAPSATNMRPSTSMSMSATSDRRAAFVQIGAAAVGLASLPSLAVADGSVSAATRNRARGIYGSRIAGLKDAVSDGDFKAIAAEKNAFVLFNSGAYAGDKATKNKAIAATNDIFAAVRKQDKAALKSAYDSYTKEFDVKDFVPVSTDGKNPGQGYSSDYDFRVRTKSGAIYVR